MTREQGEKKLANGKRVLLRRTPERPRPSAKTKPHTVKTQPTSPKTFDERVSKAIQYQFTKEDQLIMKNVDSVARALEWVKKDPCALQFLKRYCANEEVVRACVRARGSTLRWAAEPIRSHEGICRLACQSDPMALRWVHSGLRPILFHMAYKKSPWVLQLATHNQRNDEALVLDAVRRDGKVLQFASNRLRGAPQGKDGTVVRSVVEAAVQSQGDALQYAHKALRDDETIVRMAIKQYASALRHASVRFQTNLEYVLDCVDRRGSVYKHLPKAVRHNALVAYRAVVNYPPVFQYVPWSLLKKDKDLLVQCMQVDGNLLEHVHDDLQSCAVNEAALMQRPASAKFVKNQYKFATINWEKVYRAQPQIFAYIPDNFKPKKFFIENISKNPSLVLYCPKHWFDDTREFICRVAPQFPEIFMYASRRVKDDPTHVENVCLYEPELIEHASERVRNLETVMLPICISRPACLSFASWRLRNSHTFCMKVLESSGRALMLSGPNVWNRRECIECAMYTWPAAMRWVYGMVEQYPEWARISKEDFDALWQLGDQLIARTLS